MSRPAQFGQLAPAQAGLYRGLGQELPPWIRERAVHGGELLRGDDRVRPGRDRRRLDSLARVQERDLVVQGCGEDSAEDHLVAEAPAHASALT